MKYNVAVNGKMYEVEVERADDHFRPLTNEEIADGDIDTPSIPFVAPAPAVRQAPPPQPAPAKQAVVPPPSPAHMVSPSSATSSEGTIVTSPLPGSVLDIKVTLGAHVKAGQVLLIMEAMKMENEIVAPVDGVVDSMAVKKGDTVDTDAILVVLK